MNPRVAPRRPDPPKFMTYVPGRRKPYTMHTHLGHASSSLRHTAADVRDTSYDVSYKDPEFDWDRRYMFGTDCAIYKWDDEQGDWELLYEVKRGTSWADRPWKKK